MHAEQPMIDHNDDNGDDDDDDDDDDNDDDLDICVKEQVGSMMMA